MNIIRTVEIIKHQLAKSGSQAQIPYLKGGSFTAIMTPDGVLVDNLGAQPFLPWAAFQEAICVIIRNGGLAERGNAMNYRLGEPGLSLNSVEGHIALVVYGKKVGETVFRRITPVACILIWASICEASPNLLVLRNSD